MRKQHKKKLANGDVDESLKESAQCDRVTCLIYVELLKRSFWGNVDNISGLNRSLSILSLPLLMSTSFKI